MNAAGLLVVDDAEQRFLLLQRPDRSWGMPGGYLKSAETPLLGAVREFREETGFRGTLLVEPLPAAVIYVRAGRLELLPSSGQRSAGSFSYSVFRARVEKLFPPQLDGEHLDAGWFLLDEVMQLELHPGLRLTLKQLNFH